MKPRGEKWRTRLHVQPALQHIGRSNDEKCNKLLGSYSYRCFCRPLWDEDAGERRERQHNRSKTGTDRPEGTGNNTRLATTVQDAPLTVTRGRVAGEAQIAAVGGTTCRPRAAYKSPPFERSNEKKDK